MIPNDYIKSKEKILNDYNSPAIREFLNRGAYYEIGQIQKMIMEDMELGFEDKHVTPPSKNDMECIIDNLSRIHQFIMINHINDRVNSYITNIVILIKNWNDNMGQNSIIYQYINSIINLIDMNVTFRELLSMNKTLLNELNMLKDFKPAAYDTARHYQENLEKSIEKELYINERNRAD